MRGYQKRVVFLKNTGSRIFEQAYFVLREDKEDDTANTEKTDMVLEASRIIEENFGKRRLRLSRKLTYAAAFLLGALMAAVLILLLGN